MNISQLNLIPYPHKLDPGTGFFTIGKNTAIFASDDAKETAAFLRDILHTEMGLSLPFGQPAQKNSISLQLKPSRLDAESYTLNITADGIILTAPSSTGLFHGVQTLLQLIHQFRAARTLPCMFIEDTPRFPWRGFMLDEARHFHGMEQVKSILDIMAQLKMNKFHWHLTDDQGWRIESKQYPRLTEIGSRRAGTQYGLLQKDHNHIPYGGYYTQDEIRQIVQYAAERHITVIPEIEFPGHATAALAAYPEYSCSGGPFEVATHGGIYADIYCAGKEKTFDFITGILAEILSLFPGEYVHIGGDESPKKRWKNCADCRKKAAELGIQTPELQTWFTNRLAKFLQENGKKMIGWSEVLHPGLDENALLQYWLPQKKKVSCAIRQGRSVIMSPYLDVYLDHTYDLVSLRHIYEFEPIFSGIDIHEAQNILGVEAPLWSEYVWNRERLEYQLYPRLMACAETGWTAAEKKDYTGFEQRLRGMLSWLDEMKIGYAPQEEWDPPVFRHLAALLKVGLPKNHTAKGIVPFPNSH